MAVEFLERAITDVFWELNWGTRKKVNHLRLIPTGDGYAIGFDPSMHDYRILEYVAKLHVELRRDLEIRMGIHKGPNVIHVDLNDHLNMMGFGISYAQRVMGLAKTHQMLCSSDFAKPLKMERHIPELIEIGEREIKHGDKILVYNYYREGVFGVAENP